MTESERKQYHQEYYQANKERLREYARKYYAQSKEYMKKYNRIRYRKNREKFIEAARRNKEKNRLLHKDEQACIRLARRAAGLTQVDVANRLGLNVKTISLYERGCLPAPWERLREVIPGLEEEMR